MGIMSMKGLASPIGPPEETHATIDFHLSASGLGSGHRRRTPSSSAVDLVAQGAGPEDALHQNPRVQAGGVELTPTVVGWLETLQLALKPPRLALQAWDKLRRPRARTCLRPLTQRTAVPRWPASVTIGGWPKVKSPHIRRD